MPTLTLYGAAGFMWIDLCIISASHTAWFDEPACLKRPKLLIRLANPYVQKPMPVHLFNLSVVEVVDHLDGVLSV